ncbi:MAG: PQQ-binding-like beta-propeller repeat protein [Candidatus Tectomicrobia bacterium]|uniref:PQQ-binding-like beta-propeller repeat protein n=1 Tax=Tectimicrobiota bacterium TaxID=2528274 RepID=A0A932FVY1_UNCTE|nr:PQQ-binding-like beta-propeller repeat protein [Candidatus Tectomicrobia bacterium]
MKKRMASIAFLLSLSFLVAQRETLVWSQTAVPPAITALSATALTRSGRLMIQGTGFGAAQGQGRVEIGGLPAPATRWSETSITAYVPEATSVGALAVQVFTEGGASNAVPLTVTLRQTDGRVKWRFQADSLYILQRPAIGSDGTIVAHDSSGIVYALQPDGGLKWIFKTPAFAYGPPTIGTDGSVYVASLDTLYALNPDGTLKWQFKDPHPTQGAIAGPTVGPDGNIYVVNDLDGLGAFALSPDGKLLWNNPGNPVIFEYGQIGAEIVFGPSTPGGPVDQLYLAFDRQLGWHRWAFSLNGEQRWAVPTGPQADPFSQLQTQPAVGPDGTVYMTSLLSRQGWGLEAIDPQSGKAKWSFYEFPGNGMSPPDVGPDGVIYVARNLAHLHAFNPDGSERWRLSGNAIIDQPIVSPTNDLIFAGGRPNFGMPGFVQAYSTTLRGQPRWRVELGMENGGNQILYSRSRFAPDGQTVYFGTTILGGNQDNPYCYLYAMDTAPHFPELTLSLNQPTFYPGDPLALTATLDAEEKPQIVDVYVAIEFPDRSRLFLQADGSFTREIRPLVANWSTTPYHGEIFHYTIGHGEPLGSYTWLGALTEAGTSTILGNIAKAPFTVNPSGESSPGRSGMKNARPRGRASTPGETRLRHVQRSPHKGIPR